MSDIELRLECLKLALRDDHLDYVDKLDLANRYYNFIKNGDLSAHEFGFSNACGDGPGINPTPCS